MSSPRRRLLHAVDNHGGLLGLAVYLLRRKPLQQNRNEEAPEQPHPFDLAHRTETGGYIPGQHLATGAAADLYNTAYWAISPSALTAALALLPEPTTPFTFVDLGCGKGRALLLAAQHSFASIVGVELSSALCEIARRNSAPDPRIQILQADATTLDYPPGPLVVFLYHPFLAPALRRALRNLQSQLQASPRLVYLLYANPTYPRILARFAFLAEVWTHNIPLSDEDAAHDRHGITQELFTLYRSTL